MRTSEATKSGRDARPSRPARAGDAVRFPRAAFDDFVSRHMGNDGPPDVVEKRGEMCGVNSRSCACGGNSAKHEEDRRDYRKFEDKKEGGKCGWTRTTRNN